VLKNNLCDKVTIVVCSKLITIEENYGVDTKTTYNILGNGEIEVDYSININESYENVPRVGVELVIPEGFERLSYYGYGENENYSDRMLSAKLGVYHSTVEEQHFAFIPPSENGGHEGTRWLTLLNKQGNGIKISSAKPFHFDIHHNTIEDYQKATHEHKLIRRSESYLHIDVAHFGIGSNMSWSTATDENHRIKAGSYNLKFNVTII